MNMQEAFVYINTVSWLAILLVGLVKNGTIKFQWPTIDSSARYNQFAKWVSIAGFSIAAAMGFRFSLAAVFDPLALTELLSALLNLAGFALATFSVLAAPQTKHFLAGVMVNAVGWLFVTMPVGLMVAGGILSLADFHSAHAVGRFGLAVFGFTAPIIVMLEWALKHENVEARLNWSAATFVLSSCLLQVALAYLKFAG